MSVQLRLYKEPPRCVCGFFTELRTRTPQLVAGPCSQGFSCESHSPTGDMRTGSPVLPAGRRRRSSRRLLRALPDFSRNKSPAEEPQVPVLLLRNMNLCYRLLRRLVPGLPPGRAASRVEILQHVIDYILDLQTELDGSCPATEPGERDQSTDVPRKEFDIEDSWTLPR